MKMASDGAGQGDSGSSICVSKVMVSSFSLSRSKLNSNVLTKQLFTCRYVAGFISS